MEVSGHSGASCTDVSKAIVDALGGPGQREHKPEYNQPETSNVFGKQMGTQ